MFQVPLALHCNQKPDNITHLLTTFAILMKGVAMQNYINHYQRSTTIYE